MTLLNIINLIISGATLIGFIIIFYKTFRDPDQKAETEIALLKQGCYLKHEKINEIVGEIKEGLENITSNHLKHIQDDINKINLSIKEIKTIINERSKV